MKPNPGSLSCPGATPSCRAAFRLLSVWLLLVSLLLVSVDRLSAGESWPRMPTEQEIEQAKQKLLAERSGKTYPTAREIVAACEGLPPVERSLRLAQEMGDRYRLGDELIRSDISEPVLIKMHHSKMKKPNLGSDVMLTCTFTGVWEKRNGETYRKEQYEIHLLAYNEDPSYNPKKLWHFMQAQYSYEEPLPGEPGSRVRRDARVQACFAPGRFLPGFAGEASGGASGEYLQFAAEPRTSLLADGKDGVYLKARALPQAGEKPADADSRTQQIRFAAEGPGKDWVDFGKPTTESGWLRVFIQASNPNTVRGSSKPPETLTLVASYVESGKTRSKTLTLKVIPNAEIDAKPDLVEFSIKSGTTAQVKVVLDNPGSEKWAFRTSYAKKSRPLALASIKPLDASHALLTLKEAGLEPLHDGSNKEFADLSIFAEQKGRDPLERIIKVSVSQEGLFLDPLGRDETSRSYKVLADGKAVARDVDFRIFAPDPKSGRIENLTRSAEILRSVSVECLEPPESVAGRLIEAGKLEWSLAGIRPSNQPSGILRLRFAKELPSDGRVVPCEFRLSYVTAKDESYTALLRVGIQTSADGPGGRDWQIELERCQTIIRKFVPLSYQGKLTQLLDRRSRTLGPEGLKALRSRLWSVAQLLTLAEGGRGYEDEARWANYITETLDWTQWAGDMAFQAAVGSVTGPYGSVGAGMLKGFVISAINAYQEGQTPEQWLWANLGIVYGVVEGKVIDPDFFAKMGVEKKAKVWALFVSYHFLKNLYNGETVVSALKKTTFEVASNRLGAWLGEELKKSRPVPVDSTAGPSRAPDAGAARPVVADAVVQVRRNMVTTPDGRTYAGQETVLDIMRDPSKVRALKAGPADAREAFSNTRESIYRQHDAQVVQHIRDTMPDMRYRMVRVVEFRTPGQDGTSLNTDRDYRACYYAGRDPNTGREQWIEIPRRHWEDRSYRTFAELTGGPADDPVRAREWAAEHQQLATDKSHIEASRAFSDQATVWNPATRQFERVQVTSNVSQVSRERLPGVDVDDPHSLGQMYVVKVTDARFRHEAIVQANKAVGTFVEIRQAYNVQGRAIGEVPQRLRNGMEAISEARRALERDPNQRDPAAIAQAEKVLRENGFSNLNDFMRALSAQFESLKTMKSP